MAVTAIQAQEQPAVVADMHGPTNAQEMAARLADMKQRLQLVQTFFRDVMVEGQDYGIIPGTDKPTLLKAGAEKLCELYGYSIHVVTEREEKCRDTGYYDCAIKVQLVSRRTGEVIAEGVGEANTYESRYRYRWVWANQVPPDIDKSTLVTRQTKNGSLQYRLENDDLFSLWNTVRKMAKKRALIDAALSATRSSGLFTQDVEDLREWSEAAEDVAIEQPAPAPKPAAQRATRRQSRAIRQQRTSEETEEFICLLNELADTIKACGVEPTDEAERNKLFEQVGGEPKNPKDMTKEQVIDLKDRLNAYLELANPQSVVERNPF